ncbi:MAG: molybdopterin-binding protein [Nitrososphaeria archaeon]|jgi:molybdenum cofactor synthesis domain-containing protein
MSVCRIIGIGNELLIGDVVNTNASYIAKFLRRKGYFVDRIICVRDDCKAIADVILEAKRENVNYLFTTGGLGPTYDDITIESVAKALNLELYVDEEIVLKLKARAAARGHLFNEASRKMAVLPKGCIIIPNEKGAAPGSDIISDGLRIFVMPGVPIEMKGMIKNYVPKVLPNLGRYYQKKIIMDGIGESGLAQSIKEIASKYKDIYVKSHPRLRGGKYYIILHIYVYDVLSDKAVDHVKEAAKIISDRFQQYIRS